MDPRRNLTLTEVASRAGVSPATVSKVINNRDGVARPTAVRVRKVVAELGYESSLGAGREREASDPDAS